MMKRFPDIYAHKVGELQQMRLTKGVGDHVLERFLVPGLA